MYQLRELSQADLPHLTAMRNDKALVDHLGGPFRFINPETDLAWFDSYQKNRQSQVRLAIVKKDQPELPLGLVSLTGIDQISRSAEFHIMVGTKSQGQGLGPFALKEILRHAFLNLNLNRVSLTVLPDNARARAMYQKQGLREEGLLRQAVYKNGRYHDLVLMSILAEEFQG